MYLYRIHAVTFLPFRAYNTDNQLIIDTRIKYGIKPFGIFGSFAWNQQDEASDLDVFVTLQKSDFLLWKR